MTKKLYWKRVSEGVCTECGKNKPEEGKRRCRQCADKASEYKAESRAFYLKIKICPICHKNALMGQETRCLECAAIKREPYKRTPESRQKMLKYQHGYYAKCKANHICPSCGRTAAYGYTRCPICRENDRLHASLKREYKA